MGQWGARLCDMLPNLKGFNQYCEGRKEQLLALEGEGGYNQIT